MIQTTVVQPYFIPNIWDSVSSMIADACQYGNLTKDDILELCVTNPDTHRLFVVHKDGQLVGVFTFELTRDAVLKQLTTTYNSLSKPEIKELMDKIVELARSVGAEHIQGVGRKGWKRYSKQFGFKLLDNDVFDLTVREYI
jgi:CBS domain-containing protein